MTNFRSAIQEDAEFIVPLISESSGGVWPAVWKALGNDLESVDAFAIRYLCDSHNLLGISNATIAELEAVRIGVMIAYQEVKIRAQTGAPSPVSLLPDSLETALAPYRELSDPDSLFIAELCCLPESRGKGVGSQFLELAKQAAATQQLASVSLRVFSENTGAIRLYERSGFKEMGRRPVVSHPGMSVQGSVMLMACPV